MTSIFNLVPDLSAKMDKILQKYEEFHQKTYGEEAVTENLDGKALNEQKEEELSSKIKGA